MLERETNDLGLFEVFVSLRFTNGWMDQQHHHQTLSNIDKHPQLTKKKPFKIFRAGFGIFFFISIRNHHDDVIDNDNGWLVVCLVGWLTIASWFLVVPQVFHHHHTYNRWWWLHNNIEMVSLYVTRFVFCCMFRPKKRPVCEIMFQVFFSISFFWLCAIRIFNSQLRFIFFFWEFKSSMASLYIWLQHPNNQK